MRLKNLYTKLGQRGGGDWIVLVISFLLAVIVWCLLKMSAINSSDFHYRIELTTNMPGRTFTSLSEGAVVLKGKASGFTILKQRYSAKKGKNILHFSVDPAMLRRIEGSAGRFFILSDLLGERITSRISDQIEVDNISTDTLFFTFNRTTSKRVPVAIKTDLSYRKQYMAFENIRSKPDSVEIQGEEQLLSKIDSVETVTVRGRGLRQNIQGTARLKRIKGVRFSNDEVYYSQSIGRYYEKQMNITVHTTNVPAGRSMIVSPSDVVLTFRADYKVKKEFEPTDFHAFADYAQVMDSFSGKARIQLRDIPAGVLRVSLTPPFADVIILDFSTQVQPR